MSPAVEVIPPQQSCLCLHCPDSWQDLMDFCPLLKKFIKGLDTRHRELRASSRQFCGEGERERCLVVTLRHLTVRLGCSRMFLEERRGCCWKHLRVSIISMLLCCNVVILYWDKLWLTPPEDMSLKTLRVLIRSEEASLLFEAQIQWEDWVSGIHCAYGVRAVSFYPNFCLKRNKCISNTNPKMCG